MGNNIYLYISEIPRKGQHDADPGISVYRLNEQKGKLLFQEKYPLHGITNVSCGDAEKGLLYFTAEETDAVKKRTGGDRLLVLKICRETGKLEDILDIQPTLSPNPVYVTLDPDHKHLVVANHTTHNTVFKVEKDADGQWKTRAVYDDETVVLYSLREDGTIRSAEDVVMQKGSGPLRTQTHAHPHCAVFSPDGKLFAVCDKGADKVFMYAVRGERLELLAEPWASSAGDEPRFCAFHPEKPYLYVNHEGNLGLDVLQYSEEGALNHIQTVLAEPEDLEHQPGVIYEHQGIAIHPNGRFLYSVARGVDAIAVFEICPENGKLQLRQLMPINSEWPRCCQLTPDGNWLIAGTRDGGNLILYRVQENGMLEEADRVYHTCGVAYVLPLALDGKS